METQLQVEDVKRLGQTAQLSTSGKNDDKLQLMLKQLFALQRVRTLHLPVLN